MNDAWTLPREGEEGEGEEADHWRWSLDSIMSRLTADTVATALHYLNPCGLLELDLRGKYQARASVRRWLGVRLAL